LTKVRYDKDRDGNPIITVNDEHGETIYKTKILQYIPKVVEIDRRASPSSPQTTELFTYDADGFMASNTDVNGKVTNYRTPHGAAAAIRPSGWISDARTGCKIWNSNPTPGETIEWSGACTDGIASGRGVLQWYRQGEPSERYEGEVSDGKANGRGTLKTDYAQYEGDWRDGLQNGSGVFTWANGSRLEAEWRDGRANGHAIFNWISGSRFEGEFRDGRAEGTGTFYKARTGTRIDQLTWHNGCARDGENVILVGDSSAVSITDCE
jgi:hypothetical protein